jgi:hypothetical protein
MFDVLNGENESNEDMAAFLASQASELPFMNQ